MPAREQKRVAQIVLTFKNGNPKQEDQERIITWLKRRLNTEAVKVLFETE